MKKQKCHTSFITSTWLYTLWGLTAAIFFITSSIFFPFSSVVVIDWIMTSPAAVYLDEPTTNICQNICGLRCYVNLKFSFLVIFCEFGHNLLSLVNVYLICDQTLFTYLNHYQRLKKQKLNNTYISTVSLTSQFL